MIDHMLTPTVKTAFWLTGCGLLAGIVDLTFDLGLGRHESLPPVSHTPVRAAPARPFPPPPLQPAASRLEFVERPVLVVTPTPLPPPIANPAGVMRKGQFRLVGITFFGDRKTALLVEIATGETRFVEEGNTINDMAVERIESERLTLTLGGDQEQLELGAEPATEAPRPTAAPAPQSAMLAPPSSSEEEGVSAAIEASAAELRAAREQRRMERAGRRG